MLTIINNGVEGAVKKGTGKRGDVVGARFNDAERERWDRVVEIVVTRNPLAKPSDILRDFLFHNLGLVTQAERDILIGIREAAKVTPIDLRHMTGREIVSFIKSDSEDDGEDENNSTKLANGKR